MRSGRHRLGHLKHVYKGEEFVDLLTTYESARIQLAIEGSIAALLEARISLRVRRNFETYAAIRRTHGDIHLNQAFDPRETRFGPGRLLAACAELQRRADAGPARSGRQRIVLPIVFPKRRS